jgi:hypothetical protein
VVRELQGGTSNARFDFFINGIRLGYSGYKVLRSKSELALDNIEEAQREHELEAEREAERRAEGERQLKADQEKRQKERQRRELERKQRLEEGSGKVKKTG